MKLHAILKIIVHLLDKKQGYTFPKIGQNSWLNYTFEESTENRCAYTMQKLLIHACN
jgi:hypothetical protein